MNWRTNVRRWTMGSLLLLMAVAGVVALAHGYDRDEGGVPGLAAAPLSPRAAERITMGEHSPAQKPAARSGNTVVPDWMSRSGRERGHGPYRVVAGDEDHCPMGHGMMRWGGREGPRRAMGPMACHGNE